MEISKELIRGTVVPMILKLVQEQERYGYEIIKVVNERTGNAFEWKEGTVYPWLHRLEGDGLIAGEWRGPVSGRQRKYYRITRKGAAALEHGVAEWRTFTAAVNAVLCGPLEAAAV